MMKDNENYCRIYLDKKVKSGFVFNFFLKKTISIL
jgi:hypothetical protein